MQASSPEALTLFDKLWMRHLVDVSPNGEALLYVDRHLVYEVTSPQAFEGLRLSGRRPWRASTVLAAADHNVPTTKEQRVSVEHIQDPLSRAQVRQLGVNCREFGITEFGLGRIEQGIIHVVGPEQGATLPGMTVVAGDSHTSTHGAFGALAFGVGTLVYTWILSLWNSAKRSDRDAAELCSLSSEDDECVALPAPPRSRAMLSIGVRRVLVRARRGVPRSSDV